MDRSCICVLVLTTNSATALFCVANWPIRLASPHRRKTRPKGARKASSADATSSLRLQPRPPIWPRCSLWPVQSAARRTRELQQRK
ncbi:hypothetical protein V8C34DRAFT_147554 [Trichoderma compactum]